MSEISNLLQQIQPMVRELRINPWVAAILAGLLAAWMEQRRAARRAPPFTADHTGGFGMRAGRPR